MTERTDWYAPDLGIVDEPLAVALIKYRQDNRRRIQIPRSNPTYVSNLDKPNLIASITKDGRQMPILDMDFPHHFVESTTEGHTHFYIDIPMSTWRWFWLMCALRYAGVIEEGFFAWSLRRGGNFVRVPGTVKQNAAESTKPTYGWFFKLKK